MDRIGYLDGFRLSRALSAGARHLDRFRAHLDGINVFPVPDGDTGTNLMATMRAVSAAAEGSRRRSAHEMGEEVAEAALLAAQGCSGTILAQFFQGLAEGLRGHDRVTAREFGRLAPLAAARAAAAVAEPREGTLLTVLRDWAHDVDVRSREVQDFAVLLEGALGSARRSLERTPEQLAVLRDAGVVDAGAQGFLYLLEGVAELIAQGERARVATGPLPEQPAETMHAVPQAPPPRRFCTECVVVGEGLERPEVRGAFADLGESLMVGGSDRRARVHIHTDDPRQVFDAALRFGRVEREKVDDLRQQWIDAFGDVARDVAIVTDSTCDLPAELIEAYNIHVIPVRINTGARQYIDKVTITPESFGRTMAEAPEHPKTAPPPPGDFRRAYEWITRHYKSAVSIHLAGRLTTTCQVASSAAQSVSDRITVIDGRSASVGLGLVVIEAARAARDGLGHAAVVRRAEDAIRRLRVLFSVPSTEYLVRGGRISPMKGLLSRLARVQPILTFDPAGRLEPVAMAAMGQDVAAKTMALVTRDAAKRRNLRFAVGHAGAPAVASWYVEQARARFGCDDIVVADISPALTCHAGPATAGIAWLGD